MKKCDWTKLEGDELKELREFVFVGQKTIMEAYEKVLETTEQEKAMWKRNYGTTKEECLSHPLFTKEWQHI